MSIAERRIKAAHELFRACVRLVLSLDGWTCEISVPPGGTLPDGLEVEGNGETADAALAAAAGRLVDDLPVLMKVI